MFKTKKLSWPYTLIGLVTVLMGSTLFTANPASATSAPSQWDEVCVSERDISGQYYYIILGKELNENGRDFNCDDVYKEVGSSLEKVYYQFAAYCNNDVWGKICNQQNLETIDLADYNDHISQPWYQEDDCLGIPGWEDGDPTKPVKSAACDKHGADWSVDAPTWG